MVHGFLLVDKPAGVTSHDVVSAVRRAVRSRSVGHTGTLDPFATGLLVVAIGAGTKMIRFLDERSKRYHAVASLGTVTDTGDLTGKVVGTSPVDGVDEQAIQRVVSSLVGPQLQVPPMYSALKLGGKKLYELARRGEVVDRPPREITIHSIEIESYLPPLLSFRVECSPGTYVRTLAEEIGTRLGCGAHLVSLRRLSSGPFSVDDAVTLESIDEAFSSSSRAFRPLIEALPHLPRLILDDAHVRRILAGLIPRRLEQSVEADGDVLLLSGKGELVAVARFETSSDGTVRGRLLRVFPELCPLQ